MEVTATPPRRMLDLFCGTGSFGDVFRAAGYVVVSLDADLRWKPDICVDVMHWDYKNMFSVGYFDVITASPPCTEYSVALTTRPRNLDAGNVIVQRTLDIISHFLPTRWIIENPRTGLLKNQSFMKGIAYVDVDYCQFSDWGYRKATRIWGDPFLNGLSSRICDGYHCPNLTPVGVYPFRQRRHRLQLGGDFRRSGVRNQGGRHKKYRVPSALIRYVMGMSGAVTNSPPTNDPFAVPTVPERIDPQ
jgi:hypothetical protein